MNVFADIRVPANGWKPRPHQVRLWRHLMRGGKRAMAIWHRRAGKDEVCLHAMAVAMLERSGNYWYCNPEYAQGRKSIWTSVNAHTGRRRIDEAFPQELRETTNDNEMLIRFKGTGSTFQIIGSDNYDKTVGSGVAGIVYSEWALSNPSAWAYHRPIIEENDGWAAFISTPRGRNHAFTMYNYAMSQPDWFCELQTAVDTNALTDAQLQHALQEMIALYGEDAGRSQWRQEYFCDWQASVLGAFYALEMAAVRDEGRILECEALPDQYVHRSWDLGVRDDTALFWFQIQGAQLVILDCYSASGVGLEHFAEVIEQREKQHGWLHGDDFVPHDAKVKEWGTGRTRVETMQRIGLKPNLVPLASINDGINAVRRTLPLCIFHPRCQDGIDALEQYRREWDDERKAFRANPLHDWSSNYADSFRYLAQAWRSAPRREVKVPKQTGWVILPPPEFKRGGMRL